jgi:hypothetical protein
MGALDTWHKESDQSSRLDVDMFPRKMNHAQDQPDEYDRGHIHAFCEVQMLRSDLQPFFDGSGRSGKKLSGGSHEPLIERFGFSLINNPNRRRWWSGMIFNMSRNEDRSNIHETPLIPSEDLCCYLFIQTQSCRYWNR